MREKKWVDCPVCGAKGSMRYKRGLRERRAPTGYGTFEVRGLDGHFCAKCGDGFWSLKSERKITRSVGEHMAKQDSARVVAAEIASVQDAARAMRVTVQGVHKMMRDGRLRYVTAAGRRLPIREDVKNRAGTSFIRR